MYPSPFMPDLSATPAFIRPPAPCWPFVQRLSQCHLVTTEFDAGACLPWHLEAFGLASDGGSLKRQAEFLAGRFCAAGSLRAAGHPAVFLERDSASRRALWPQGICGSITHSHGVAASISGYTKQWQALGLDQERMIAPARALRLQQAILTPAEQAELKGLTDEVQAARITLLFSAKESLFKALNPLTDQYFGFQDAQVSNYAQDGRLTLQLLRDLSDIYRSGMEFPCLWSPYAHGMLTLVYLAA